MLLNYSRDKRLTPPLWVSVLSPDNILKLQPNKEDISVFLYTSLWKKASCNKQSPELKACSLGSESPKLTKCTTHITEMVWYNFLIDLCLLFKMRYFVLKVPLYPKYFPKYFVLRKGGIGNQLREPNALQESETIKKKLSLSFLWDYKEIVRFLFLSK